MSEIYLDNLFFLTRGGFTIMIEVAEKVCSGRGRKKNVRHITHLDRKITAFILGSPALLLRSLKLSEWQCECFIFTSKSLTHSPSIENDKLVSLLTTIIQLF